MTPPMVDTARGQIAASLLTVDVRHSETAAGQLITTRYFYEGEVVKIDQHLDVSEAALLAGGLAQL